MNNSREFMTECEALYQMHLSLKAAGIISEGIYAMYYANVNNPARDSVLAIGDEAIFDIRKIQD